MFGRSLLLRLFLFGYRRWDCGWRPSGHGDDLSVCACLSFLGVSMYSGLRAMLLSVSPVVCVCLSNPLDSRLSPIVLWDRGGPWARLPGGLWGCGGVGRGRQPKSVGVGGVCVCVSVVSVLSVCVLCIAAFGHGRSVCGFCVRDTPWAGCPPFSCLCMIE